MKLKPEHSKFSAYFNVDNGTGAIRGVYLQGNEAVAPIFQAWMQPFKNLGMTTLTIRRHGRYRSSVVRCCRTAGISIHPGPDRIRHPNSPLQHGCVRTDSGGGLDERCGHRRVVRLSRGESGRTNCRGNRLPPPQPAAKQQRGVGSQTAKLSGLLVDRILARRSIPSRVRTLSLPMPSGGVTRSRSFRNLPSFVPFVDS